MLDLTKADTGCYIDGHWGQYGASRLLSIADSLLGTSYYWEAHSAMSADPDSPDPDGGCVADELPGCEITSELADEAEAALNDATPAGLVWHWYEGEFFLSPHCGGDDLDRCDDEACYCQTY